MIKDNNLNGKIISYNNYKSAKNSKNKKIVLVGGCFDLIHYGHIVFLNKAREQGDYLIIALESDQFIKKKRLNFIHNQEQRAIILASLIMVDLVIKLPYFASDKEYFNLVKNIHPNLIAITEGDKQIVNKRKQATLIGAKLEIITQKIDEFSSSNIIKKYETIFSNRIIK